MHDEAVLAKDIAAEFPWLILERLPRTDLGAVIENLSDAQLDRIAAGVATAQTITAKTGSTGRYGCLPTRAGTPRGLVACAGGQL